MVGDVDALQGLYLRGLGPPLVALARRRRLRRRHGGDPARGGARPRGRADGRRRRACRLLAAALGRARSPQARRAGELTAELVELAARRAGARRLRAGRSERSTRVREARPRARAPRPARRARRRARRRALGARRRRSTVAGVLAVAVAAHDAGSLDRVLVATLTLLALASFEGVAPLPGPRRSFGDARCGAARARADRRRAGVPTRRPCRCAVGPPAVALESVTARYAPRGSGARKASTSARARAASRARRPERRRQDDGREPPVPVPRPREGRVTIDGSDIREYRQEDVRRTFALAGQERARLQLDDPREPPPRPPGRERGRAPGRAPPRALADGSPRCPTGSTRSSARRDAALGRPATAPRARAGAARRRAGARPRRADRAPRPRDGAGAHG